MSHYPLNGNIFNDPDLEPTRVGFGRGLKNAGEDDERVVALCADLTESVQMHLFRDTFPDRFIEVGVAEQNLVTVGAGMAKMGKIPFTASYAAFSPGRNWEQIRTTICLNNQPVKIVGAHSGVTVGPDGATHQALEDIALMRVLPNMVVVCPGDSIEAEKATQAIAKNDKPSYIRLAREKTPIFSVADSPFEIGKAYVLKSGDDVTLASTGIITPFSLQAAKKLESEGISVEHIHIPTIKPLDKATILASIRKTGRIVTAEDAQIAGGLGGVIAELLGSELPTPLFRIGVEDRFGESGSPMELIEHFGLDADSIAQKVRTFTERTPKYHQ